MGYESSCVMIERLMGSFSSNFKAILRKAITFNLGNLKERRTNHYCRRIRPDVGIRSCVNDFSSVGLSSDFRFNGTNVK